MSQPPPYTPSHSFVSDSATLANFPGQALDVEFAAIEATTDAIEANLSLIQRDDGQLENGIVTFDSLSAGLQTNGIAPAVAWASGTAYAVGNNVMTAGSLYRCAVAHTSGVFAADLATGKWTLVTALPTGGATLSSSNTFTAGPQTIAPPANSLTQGLVVTQSGPTSGTTAGPFSYNLINVTDGNNAISDTGHDAFDTGGANSTAFRVDYTMSADNVNPRIGGSFNLNYTGTSTVAQPVGLFGSVYTNSQVQSMWGVIGYNSLGPTGQSEFMFPIVSELSAQTGSSVHYRSAYVAYTEAPVQGSIVDAVMTVAGFDIGRGAPGGFKNVIALSNFIGGSNPLDPTANFFWSQSAATIGSFANLPNITVTGNILNFPNMAVNGAGAAVFGAPIAALSPSYTIQAGNGTTTGVVGLGVTANTATGSAFVNLNNSTVAAQMIIFANEAARTTVRYGKTLGNWNEISAFVGNGLIVGTNNATSLILGTNNVNRVEITAAGAINIPGLTASTALALDSSKNVVSVTNTGSGNNVLATNPTITNPNTVGTATNDNAAAGSIGEYIENVVASGSAVALTTNVAKTVASIALTAGDWDVSGLLSYLPANTTSVNALQGSLSLTTNALDVTVGRFNSVPMGTIVYGGTTVNNLPMSPYRFSLAAPATIFLTADSTFSVAGNSAFGMIRARRMR